MRYCRSGNDQRSTWLFRSNQHADTPHSLRLLRARCERPSRRAGEKRDELTPFQPIKLHVVTAGTWVGLQDSDFAAVGQRVHQPVLQPDGRLHCTPEVCKGSFLSDQPAPDALGMSASLRSRPNLRTAAIRRGVP